MKRNMNNVNHPIVSRRTAPNFRKWIFALVPLLAAAIATVSPGQAVEKEQMAELRVARVMAKAETAKLDTGALESHWKGRSADQVIHELGLPSSTAPLPDTGGELLIYGAAKPDRYVFELERPKTVAGNFVRFPGSNRASQSSRTN